MAWYNKNMRRSYKGIRKNTNKYDCLAHEHEVYRPLYRVWGTMIRRCTNPKCDMYPSYGGRGVKVCERWSNPETGFINFYRDMGERPVDENGRSFQIDRIDVNGDYCPENCRWVSARDNCRNRRSNIRTTLYGDEMCLTEICDLLHLKRTTVNEKIRLGGKTPEDAIVETLAYKYRGLTCAL